MDSTAILFSFLGFILLVLFLFMMKDRFSYKRVPPGSLGMPLSLELVKAMREKRGEEWLQERARKYGHISKLNFVGTPTVLVAAQANNKLIYAASEKILSSKQPHNIRRLFGDKNILELTAQDHKRVRKALLSFLKPDALKLCVAKVDAEVRLHLSNHWSGEHQIPVLPLMRILTFDVISTVLFGLERGSRRDALVTLFEQVVTGMVALPINLPFTLYNKSLRARAKAGDIIREVIREKREILEREGMPEEQDLIFALLSLRDEATGAPLMTDKEIEDNCAISMIGGHDTTSVLLTYMIKYLGEYPDVYQNVVEEQEEIARGKKTTSDPLTWEDLGKMKYTWRVATEALRMHSPFIFTFRKVVQDFEIGGYVIPKGWQVLLAGCMTQMDESIYPDPYKFNPSRYEDPKAKPAHTFIAFGAGPRMCPGNELVKMESLIMMHYLVTHFEWKLCLEENIASRNPVPTFDKGMPIQIQTKNRRL